MYNKNSIFIRLCFAAYLSISVLFFAAELSADSQEDTIKEETKLLEQEVTKELEAVETAAPKKGVNVTFKYGGWLNTSYRNYKNTDNDELDIDTVHNVWWNDLRLWGKFTFFDKHVLYLRMKNSYTQRKTDIGYTGIGDDYDGPHLDNGYLKLDFADMKIPATLTLGRQYFFIGRGIAYSATNDGVKLTLNPNKFFIKSFLSKTQPYEDNVDPSVPNYEKRGERVFAGTELTYLGIPNNVIYAYGLIQRDETDATTATQDYNYHSKYFGLGFEGNSQNNDGYWLEIIKQKGRNFTDASDVALEKRDIDAWALDMGLKHYFKNIFRPKVEFEYAYGSGDRDRDRVDYTNGGGNIYGEDKNFLYFGGFYGGYALSPRLSNLNAWKIEGSIKPLAHFKSFKDIIVGLKYWLFRKDKEKAGIYDTDATQPSKDIGSEIDAYVYYNITKRMFWLLRYGVFLPGKAYPGNTQAHTKYVYTRLTITF